MSLLRIHYPDAGYYNQVNDMTMSPTVRLKLLRPKQHLSSSPMTVRPFAKSCSQALTYDETLNWVNLVEFGDAYFEGSHIPLGTSQNAPTDICRGFIVPEFVPVPHKKPRFLYFKNRGYCIVVSLSRDDITKMRKIT